MSYIVHFLPENRKISGNKAQNLLSLCQQADLLMDGSCAGKGICGRCRVQITQGQAGELTEAERKYFTEEEIEAGYRLACQCVAESDLTVRIPELKDQLHRKKEGNGLPEGFLQSLKDSSEMEKSASDPSGKQEIAEDVYGIAFDLGTTTIVGILWNQKRVQMLDVEARTNPQSSFGADVISRIQYCIREEKAGRDGTALLQEKVIACMNQMIADLCRRTGVSRNRIEEMTLVGNTTMTHLFLGKNPAGLAKAPFEPVYQGGMTVLAEEMQLQIHPQARIYVLPNIAGHVGADLTGVMLATDLLHRQKNSIVIDIGTNGEIFVASAKKNQVLACSTAAGPAFEGACISCGMRAAAGAIEKVEIQQDITVETIEGVSPVGICGSGLIDVTAQLLKVGLIKKNGNLLTREQAVEKGICDALAMRLQGTGKEKRFVLAATEEGYPIVLTQKDIREVQLAKGAILGGILTLMDKLEMTTEEIDEILIAGAFGNCIDKKNAIAIGLIPNLPEEKVISIGNAAGVGASMALLSKKHRLQAEKEVEEIKHIELSSDSDFQDYYIQSMVF